MSASSSPIVKSNLFEAFDKRVSVETDHKKNIVLLNNNEWLTDSTITTYFKYIKEFNIDFNGYDNILFTTSVNLSSLMRPQGTKLTDAFSKYSHFACIYNTDKSTPTSSDNHWIACWGELNRSTYQPRKPTLRMPIRCTIL